MKWCMWGAGGACRCSPVCILEWNIEGINMRAAINHIEISTITSSALLEFALNLLNNVQLSNVHLYTFPQREPALSGLAGVEEKEGRSVMLYTRK